METLLLITTNTNGVYLWVLDNPQYPLSHFVVNLKWIVGGQVNQIISIIIDNSKNNNTNISLKGFQHQFFRWGQRKVFTSIAAFRHQDLRRKVQLFLCGRPRDHEILSITARVRSDEILNWNLAAIRIISFSIKVRCPWLYKQNVLKVLLVAREKKKSGFITCEDMTRDITRF